MRRKTHRFSILHQNRFFETRRTSCKLHDCEFTQNAKRNLPATYPSQGLSEDLHPLPTLSFFEELAGLARNFISGSEPEKFPERQMANFPQQVKENFSQAWP